jgi:hypothetical protein
MADTNHKDYENIVHDLIDNAIVPYPNSVNILLADHGDAGRWTRILGKQCGISDVYALCMSKSRPSSYVDGTFVSAGLCLGPVHFATSVSIGP